MLQPYYKNTFEAGIDEAGRGCIAGPVTAAAVIFPAEFSNPELNDSKKLSKKKRNELRILIEQEALAYAVFHVDTEIIDKINILNATFFGMHQALQQLSIVPQSIVIDGNLFKPYKDIPHTCIVKGDSKFQNIAAASILAKTYRDELLENYATKYPNYAWQKNKGYPTKEHRQAVCDWGITPLHRKSFRILPHQLDFGFSNSKTC